MLTLILAGQLATAMVIDAPMPDGFVEGHRAGNASQTIEERIPAGETVHAWTRMITLQNFMGAIPPSTLFDRVAAGFAASCPGSPPAALASTTTDGRTEATISVICNRNPSHGGPEVMFGRAIGTPTSLHVVQYAFRSVPAAAEADAARAYLAAARLCPVAGCRPAQ